uniref:Phosphofurin acidic cluster sorting protein 1 n=1 Tax=Syphacia muris TaxID=451379 RepID=A0A0N5AZH6_9BILA
MEMNAERVVPMRLVANWETDRASTSAVQRMFTMSLSRMAFKLLDDQQYSFVITVKLLGIKRTLRSNDIQATISGGRLDIPLNISFAIQYPHFLKRKGNILQILLQRRKRYKNRQIPGYKTLALGLISGTVNLSEVLQNGNLKEILLFDPDCEKDERSSNSPIGRILVSSCQSLALELENEFNAQRIKEKEVESEEEEGTSSEAQYSDNDQENGFVSRRKPRLKMRNNRDRKWVQRKNLKQKFISLIKKFKISEEGVVGSTARVENGPSTAKQLEELFEELEGLSDSGPEMVGDNLSIISNPRPGLTPYFPSASREVLPCIKDRRSDESDEEWSSEVENTVENVGLSSGSEKSTCVVIPSLKTSTCKSDSGKVEVNVGSTEHFMEEAKGNMSSNINETVTLMTGDSALTADLKTSLASHCSRRKSQAQEEVSPRSVTFSERLSNIFHDVEPWSPNVRLCICSLSTLPVLSSLESTYTLIDCNTFNECRMFLSTVVAKIQNFCNNSSATPPSTILFVVGYEKLINNVLRSYVESLQTKSVEWIDFLRFCVILPPKSSLGVFLKICTGNECTFKELFENRLNNETVLEELKSKMDLFAGGDVIKVPIGEAMLQLHKKLSGDESDSQVFVPFLAEVKIGQFVDDLDVSVVNRFQEDAQTSVSQFITPASHTSPPLSPHSSQKTSDLQELQIEYWVPTLTNNDFNNSGSFSGNFSASPMNSNSKRDVQLTKNSIRSTFRSFSIFRKKASDTLCLSFVKEKRKEKMFQKLGMKKGGKSDIESSFLTSNVKNVSRLICSGKHPLSVSIDGNLWTGVRFFQASMQWQTHVKHFPICLPAEEKRHI